MCVYWVRCLRFIARGDAANKKVCVCVGGGGRMKISGACHCEWVQPLCVENKRALNVSESTHTHTHIYIYTRTHIESRDCCEAAETDLRLCPHSFSRTCAMHEESRKEELLHIIHR
jgi:hypothetical protein